MNIKMIFLQKIKIKVLQILIEEKVIKKLISKINNKNIKIYYNEYILYSLHL